MPSDFLQKVLAGGVMTLTLNRPNSSNPLNRELLQALGECVEEAAYSPAVRCVVLSGAGRDFSCGADLVEMETLARDPAWTFSEELKRHFHPILLGLRSLEKPVVASVNGLTSGIGASLALACDIVAAAEDASFVCSFSGAGLMATGLVGRLAERMGVAKALEHAWTAKPVPAQEALACGLVNLAVPPYRLESATFDLVRKLLEAPPRCAGLLKKAMNLAGRSFAEELEYESQLQDILCRTKDHAEGLAALLEKRPPSFTGG